MVGSTSLHHFDKIGTGNCHITGMRHTHKSTYVQLYAYISCPISSDIQIQSIYIYISMSMNIISIISHIKWYQIFDFNMKTHPLNPMVGTRLRGGPGGALGALYEKE